MKTILEPLNVLKTKGSLIYVKDDKILIDAVSSWWTSCHGYNHPTIISSMQKQLRQMPHIMFGGLIHTPAITLAKRLVSILPKNLNKVFFSDSGSVAVEIALKMLIQYWKNKGYNNKNKFIYFKNGYHGDTSGAMSVCDPEDGMHHIFNKHISKNFMAHLPTSKKNKDKLKQLIVNKHKIIAGIIIEPLLQAAGGMKTYKPEVLDYIGTLSKKYNIPTIFDEIATGFGRTGTMFALDQTRFKPDILCIGKALTGGTISLAATIASNKIYNAFLSNKEGYELMHGPTFMANPLACAAANASLDIFHNEDRISQVKRIETILKDGLKECIFIKGVKDVRVIGAMGAVEINKMNTNELNWFKKRFIEKNIWLRPFGNILYTMPSFVITDKQLFKIISAIKIILKEWSATQKSNLS